MQIKVDISITQKSDSLLLETYKYSLRKLFFEKTG